MPQGALLATRGPQEAQAYAYIVARATSRKNPITILYSLFLAALRRPRGGNVTCLRVAIDFPTLESVALKFEHVQISNHMRAYVEKLYHVTRFFWELPSRPPRGPEVARR